MRKKIKAQVVPTKLDLNQQIVLFCAMRYALGRKTYVVGAVVEELHKHWNVSLNEGDKSRIVQEILEHKERFGDLGMECDEREWMSLVERYNNEHQNIHGA